MRVTVPAADDALMPDLSALAPDIVAAASALRDAVYERSTLPLRLFEAARIATAAVNGCVVCCNWRSARDVPLLSGHQVGAAGAPPDEAFYQSVLADALEELDERERLVAIYARRMGTDPQGLARDDDFWDAFKAQLTDAQIVELTYCIACWIGMGRATHVLGRDQACVIPSLMAAEPA